MSSFRCVLNLPGGLEHSLVNFMFCDVIFLTLPFPFPYPTFPIRKMMKSCGKAQISESSVENVPLEPYYSDS